MSSGYYGNLAGDLADQQARAEQGFLAWVDEFTRGEMTLTTYEQLQAAFHAGFELGSADKEGSGKP